jgi:uncharacterized protein YdcH (DUF465 family)
MNHTPHELAEEFPDAADRIHDLRLSDPHFARLVEDYHIVNRAIHRAEIRDEVITGEAEAELRRRRMRLKDEIARLIAL